MQHVPKLPRYWLLGTFAQVLGCLAASVCERRACSIDRNMYIEFRLCARPLGCNVRRAAACCSRGSRYHYGSVHSLNRATAVMISEGHPLRIRPHRSSDAYSHTGVARATGAAYIASRATRHSGCFSCLRGGSSAENDLRRLRLPARHTMAGLRLVCEIYFRNVMRCVRVEPLLSCPASLPALASLGSPAGARARRAFSRSLLASLPLRRRVVLARFPHAMRTKKAGSNQHRLDICCLTLSWPLLIIRSHACPPRWGVRHSAAGFAGPVLHRLWHGPVRRRQIGLRPPRLLHRPQLQGIRISAHV